MMKKLIALVFATLLASAVQAQEAPDVLVKKVTFIPKGTPQNKKTFLLVEPNNTGKITDSTDVHKKYAIDLASVSSVGNNVSTELKIPLLVPVFPRPASQPLMYTHALDRDVMEEKFARVETT